MKKPKLTPWFPADVKPVHVGVYEVRGSNHMWLWNGSLWCSAGKIPWICQGQYKVWRGLANPPKATGQCLKGEE